MDKVDFNKINVFSVKKILRIKQATDWEKIFASHIFNEGLICRIYRKLNNKNK